MICQSGLHHPHQPKLRLRIHPASLDNYLITPNEADSIPTLLWPSKA